MWRGRAAGIWLFAIAGLLLCLALAAPIVLSPANRLWSWIGLKTHAVVNPVVIALLFFGVLTPVGLLMRLAGKDSLRLRFDAAASSYWIARPMARGQKSTMKLQF